MHLHNKLSELMMMMMMMMLLQMSGSKQYKPLDETTAPADVAATQEEDTKKGCTRWCVCVRAFSKAAQENRTVSVYNATGNLRETLWEKN